METIPPKPKRASRPRAPAFVCVGCACRVPILNRIEIAPGKGFCRSCTFKIVEPIALDEVEKLECQYDLATPPPESPREPLLQRFLRGLDAKISRTEPSPDAVALPVCALCDHSRREVSMIMGRGGACCLECACRASDHMTLQATRPS